MARTMFLNLSAIKEVLELWKSLADYCLLVLRFRYRARRCEHRQWVRVEPGDKINTYSYKHFIIEAASSKEFQVWKNSLALAGKEGTTVNRFRGMDVSGNAWLKTGSLDKFRPMQDMF